LVEHVLSYLVIKVFRPFVYNPKNNMLVLPTWRSLYTTG